MPGQSGQSAFSFVGAVRDAAKKPTDFTEKGFTELPGGVEGVAELVEAKLSTYKTGNNAGKKFIRLAGAVRTPETAIDKKEVFDKASKRVVTLGEPKVVTIRGRQTSIMLPLCETRNAAGVNVENAINEIKKLAGAEFVAPLASAASEAAAWQTLEGLIKTLNATPVQFKFRTRWKNPTAEYPEGGVWDHEWLGAVSAEAAQVNGSSGVVDETGGGDENYAADGAGDGATPEPEAGTDDWDSLVAEWEGMDDGDEKDAVCERILDLAVAAGVDRDAAAATADWDECKALMDAAAGGDEEPPAEEPFEPVKGGVYGYETETLKDPKNPKKGKVKKKIEVVVKSVNKTKSTVFADDNATKKPVAGADKRPLPIPFDALIVE